MSEGHREGTDGRDNTGEGLVGRKEQNVQTGHSVEDVVGLFRSSTWWPVVTRTA